jgi:hypothetical protein
MNHYRRFHQFIFALAVAVFVLVGGPAWAGDPVLSWGVVPSPNAGAGDGSTLTAVSVLSASDMWAVGSLGFSITVEPQVQHWNGSTWQIVPVPAEVGGGELFGVEAIATDDVWMVGGYQEGGGALILHWDGEALSVVEHPNPGGFNRFYAIASTSATDVWAVGEHNGGGGISQTLIEHWGGQSWQVVASPTDPGNYTQLLGVSAIATNDAWAVGAAGAGTFAIHWDGTAWEAVSTPTPGGYATLKAVSSVANNDVWAVGDGIEGTLTLHWNGSQWEIVPSPTPSEFFNDLNGVVALAADDVWAVGFYAVGGDWQTLTLHWDGEAWSQVASPSPDPSLNLFNGVDNDASSGEVWAVGRGMGTLVAHWNNTAWEVVPSANLGTADNELNSLDAIAPDDIWAVGTAGDNPLTEHWDGSSWSIVPSPDFAEDAELNGVSAVASNDVWAVGTTGDGGWIDFDTVTIHWNGSEWTTIPSPNSNSDSYNELHAVAAVASDDVWAVGEYLGDDVYSHPLILHWDGISWSIVPQNCDTYNALIAITVVAPDDIWATGNALTCHYDGNTWTEVPSPQPRPDYNEIGYSLEDIDAVSADDIWIVGYRVIDLGQYLEYSPLAEHWDGTEWTAFYDFPVLGYGVVALANDDVWAVGTGIAHWDGTSWTEVPSPTPGEANQLNDVDALAADNLWAVGFYFSGDFVKLTLVEHAPSETTGTVQGSTNHGDALITWLGQVSGSTETDEFGDYEVAGLPAGTYTFIAAADSCTPDMATVEVVAGATVFQDFEIDCTAPPAEGMVLGSSNYGGALISWSGPESGTTEADEFGNYIAADLTAGTYTFAATMESCVPDETVIEVVAGTLIFEDFEIDCSAPPPPPPTLDYNHYLPIVTR